MSPPAGTCGRGRREKKQPTHHPRVDLSRRRSLAGKTAVGDEGLDAVPAGTMRWTVRKLVETFVEMETFLFELSPTSHPRLAHYKAFATVYFVLKLDINSQVGLVTVVSLGVVSGEGLAYLERPSRSHFPLDSHQQAIFI